MSDTLTLVGFHGTSEENARRIERAGFQPSQTGWLGYGIYFYLEGISDPVQDAKGWAISETNHPNKPTYERFCILETHIQAETTSILDLRLEEDLNMFHQVTRALKEEVISRCYDEGSKIDIGDSTLCREAAKRLKLQGFIGWFYSQVDPRERSLKVKNRSERFRVPNVTVLCILDVATIKQTSILECDQVS